MKLFSHRFAFFIAFITVVGLLGGALYLQMYEGVNPCTLCILQRMTLIVLGLMFLIGILVSSKKLGAVSVSVLSFLIAATGIFVSGRQVWLQHSPESATTNCDVSLQYMIQVLPFHEVVKKIFQGGAECTQVGWQFLHLSLAEWSLISFVVFALFSLWQLFRR